MTATKRTQCTLSTASGTHELALRTADSFLTRFRGLMLSGPLEQAEGMLITHCSSVHSAFMRYPIDVVYLDRHGFVTRCVRHLKPWRASHSSFDGPRAVHTLELAAGTITALGIAPGDRLSHPCLEQPVPNPRHAWAKQRGSAMIEFAVVGPLIALLGLGTLQYGMMFFAKNQINYASFMAAREGSFAHADLGAVQQAYVRALAPMYGGGETADEVAQSVAKASADMAGNMQIEMLNPTKESFVEWNDETLQALLKTGSRHVIPNSALAARPKLNEVGASSGQSLHDANLLKLKITHGYLPKVPIIGKLYLAYLKWADQHTDDFQTKLINDGRIPVVTHVTLEMHSDAIEPGNPVSIPGAGNGGKPADPGSTPVTQGPPPDCTTLSCRNPAPPPSSDPEPACNPFTDPNHCKPPTTCDSSQMCCIPPEWTPKT
ncbi:DUF192 domain-containing protein [Massilia solisilvae]|uniref:DUF192 domain-containing protein n=1 Tax=Massilia solisilvae TaxID=1811225 RepID=A0ABT2BE19_9BURK|nr:DUF192 domain-containing protein [Massilia solisilvae]MCS0606661.1 DUF192 domain-containing protein [Massilia solisilvae]